MYIIEWVLRTIIVTQWYSATANLAAEMLVPRVTCAMFILMFGIYVIHWSFISYYNFLLMFIHLDFHVHNVDTDLYKITYPSTLENNIRVSISLANF